MITSSTERQASGGLVISSNLVVEISDDDEASLQEELKKLPPSERAWILENQKEVAVLCAHNGIEPIQFAQEASSITSLEMCFYNIDRMQGFSHFPALVSLCIVAQDIQEIEGLGECPQLQQLWICETAVGAIRGLDALTELRELYLYGNRIRRIEGLDNCKSLGKLWLCDNDISVLENLQHLGKLRELHLGNNQIESVGDALAQNTQLEVLNLSGNRTSSFREITFLAQLVNLKVLCLSDPNFAESPICSLYNYQTHVIYHLPNLEVLDTMEITEESRRIINATVVKKRMYYSMRISTIKRNENFLLKHLSYEAEKEERVIAEDLRQLLLVSKRAEKRLHDCEPHSAEEQRWKAVIEQLDKPMTQRSKMLKSVKQYTEKLTETITNMGDTTIRKLQVELETGGNVRFEELDRTGADSQPDVHPEVIEHLRSTQSSQHTIHKILQIHNGYLKGRFETKLNERSVIESTGFEYLFYHGALSEGDSDVLAVIEHGFEVVPREKPVVLSNGLAGNTGSGDKSNPGRRRSQTENVQLKAAVLVRAYVGNCERTASLDNYSLNCSEFDSACQTTSAGKTYIVKDRALLLPCYIVEYSDGQLDSSTTSLETLLINIAMSSQIADPDMPERASELLRTCSLNAFQAIPNIPSVEELLNETPDLRALGERTVATPQKRKQGGYSVVNLTSSPTPAIETLMVLNLQTLMLVDCKLDAIPDLSRAPLTVLDVSFNAIACLKPAARCRTLKQLHCVANRINDCEDIACLLDLRVLEVLDLRLNRVCESKGYDTYLMRNIPSLLILDGLRCDRRALKAPSTFDPETLLFHGTTQRQPFRPLCTRTDNGHGSSVAQIEFGNLTRWSQLAHGMRVEHLTTLELDHCGLHTLEGLPTNLHSLTHLSLRHNNLTSTVNLSVLQQYPSLTDLDLSHNALTSLITLPDLTKLCLSNNNISNLDWMREFTSLLFLAVEWNEIADLRPLDAAGLMELYCGNNKIADLLTVYALKDLPRLIVLDLSGNAVCEAENYKLFTAYHLGRLKILDGSPLTPSLLTTARETFLGLLTPELLTSKIGHSQFRNISELDLRNCRFREISCFPAPQPQLPPRSASVCEYKNLRKLTLDNNLLTCIDSLLGLTQLRYLSLNANRIERLLSNDVPALDRPVNATPDDRGQDRYLLPRLEELHLGYNLIGSIKDLQLHRMAQLKGLFLQGNRISRIDGLEHMTMLHELVLDKNQIKNAEPSSFVSLINLRDLHIKENRLKTLSHFDSLPNLEHLYLQNNRLHDLTEIEKLRLPSLTSITLHSTPLSRKPLYRTTLIVRFPHVQRIDDVEVDDEERVRAERWVYEMRLSGGGDRFGKGHLGVDGWGPRGVLGNSIGVMGSGSGLNGGVPGGGGVGGKAPVKISSVVLDGLEMKLSSSTGFRDPFGRP
ncbi:hypothetical protein BC832DRAFT_545188 [Gaertneriomyces semiglobifer]|nr:hypothetical protein BC832DRAFT_545188 [Gaertneriomyces semiglobifer]